MNPSEMSNDTTESPRRFGVSLKLPQPRLLGSDVAHAFIDDLRQEEDSRLQKNPPLGICTGFAQERDKWDILCLPESENKTRTGHSLGDEETTVFISEFGELVCFRKFLGLGVFGTVQMEPPVLDDAERVDEFHDILDGRLPGLGLRLQDRKQSQEHKIDYVHDRWPRVSFKFGNLDIKVQFVVDQGVVVQQYLIHNPSQALSTCDFRIDLGFGARPSTVGLWWEGEDNSRLLTHGGISLTAGGHAAMLWAGDERGQVQLDVGLFQDGRSVKLDLSKYRRASSESVVDTPLNKPEYFDASNVGTSSPYHFHTIMVRPGVTQELTALYSLERYSLKDEQEQALQPKDEVEQDNRSGRKEAVPEDEATASNPIQSASVKETTDRVLSTELHDTGTENCRSKQEETAQEDSFWNYDGENSLNDLESRTNRAESSTFEAEIPNQHLLNPGPEYKDASKFLGSNYHGNWTLESRSTSTIRLLRRHLQQVLFVSSVSVPQRQGLRSAIFLSAAHLLDNEVPAWGSLCMFRFLLSMYAFLDQPRVVELTLREYLKCQIKDTCGRHLDWIFDVAKPFQRGWARYYNLNGLYLRSEESHEWGLSWYCGAVNFVKLYEYRMVFQTLDDELFVLQKLHKRLGPWLESLDERKDPKSHMWSSYHVSGEIDWLDPQYRQDESVELPAYVVADLIVLWKALSCVFELLDNADLMVLSLAKSGTSELKIWEVNNKLDRLKASLPSNWRRTFSPSKLRTRIMDHFTYDLIQGLTEPGAHMKDAAVQEEELDSDKDTIENLIGEAGAPTKEVAVLEEIRGEKNIMEDSTRKLKYRLAKPVKHRKEFDSFRRKQILVFRWIGNDKPRYLWYSWASPIFEAVNSGFFKGEFSSRIWKDTLEAQRVHRAISWDKVARYALALRAAQYGQSFDVTMDANRMRKEVKARLMKSFLSNGTFPTRLDLTSKQPTGWVGTYQSGPVYEIPLLLLQEETKCLDLAAFLADTTGGRPGNPILLNIPTLRQDAIIVKVFADRNAGDTTGNQDNIDSDPEAVAKERAKMAKSARHRARSTKVDRANIRDPPDFEPDWLFPYPDCFAPKEDTRTLQDIYKQTTEEAYDLRKSIVYTEEPAYKVLWPGIHKYCSIEPGKESTFFESIQPGRLTVIDIAQATLRKMPNASFPRYHSGEIQLLSKRTWKTAKKRLTIINSCQPEHALLLYLGSAESEKLSTAGFLTRHKMREDFMRDYAHKGANMWTTELHLSFYKKITITSDDLRSLLALKESIFEGPEKLSAFPGKSKASLDKLHKGAIGWRFSGDLHDRRWTGTILAFTPGMEDADWITNWALESGDEYGQRKIIEARLFSEITKTIYVSTREILRDLNVVLGEGDGGIYRGSSEHHDPLSETFDQSYSRSKLYLELSDFLSHLDDSFKNTMETIEAYVDREKQRPVQPRWSIEDERQYRPELQKWDQEGKKNIALLWSIRNEISTKMSRVNRLRESLNADMQLRETRLQARSAEDVRLFTYVTIIFLPISFSSSLFSMSKAPDNSLVGTFAKVSVIALVITFVILLNLKTMSRNMWTYFNAGLHKISDMMSTSSWDFWKKAHIELVQAEKRNIQSDEPLEIRKMSRWWYCLFFLAFVLWELPAIRVLLAWDVFLPPTEKDPKQPRILTKIIRVFFGLFSLPLFVFSFALVFLLRNLIDLFKFLLSLKPGKQKILQDSKTFSDHSDILTEPKINTVNDGNSNKRASESKKVEKVNLTNNAARNEEILRAYEEKYNARVMRLTQPPSLFRSFATASDRRSKGATDREKDQDSKIEGENCHSPSSKNPIMAFLNHVGLKVSPVKEPQTVRKNADLESNDEQGSRAVQGEVAD